MDTRIARGALVSSLAATAAVVATCTTVRADPSTAPLVDQDGTAFSLSTLPFAVTALTFIATRCTDTCPQSEALFVALAARIRRLHLDAGLLLVTLDPAYDSPFVLSRTARALGAAAPRFRLATAGSAATPRLVRRFGVEVAVARGVPAGHSTFVYVLDAHGAVTRTFPLTNRLSDYLAGLGGQLS